MFKMPIIKGFSKIIKLPLQLRLLFPEKIVLLALEI